MFAALKDRVLGELAKGTHTEAFADGARFALTEAHKLAEPAPVVTDEAVDAAGMEFYGVSFGKLGEPDAARGILRAAVQAAAPLLGPRPLLDREAVEDVLREFSNGEPASDADGWVLFADDLGDLHGALVAAGVARPMPTREQIAAVLDRFGVSHDALTPDLARREIADAVLALINGGAKCVCLHDESGTEVSALCAEHGDAK